MKRSIPIAGLVILGACAHSAGDPRYPAREAGCSVKAFPGESPILADELGDVRVECSFSEPGCERQLLDAVCARGGDILWGTGEAALTARPVIAHAAHSRRAVQGPLERGCAVQVFADAPSGPTENIGTVVALCAEDDAKDVCLRELEDQVCGLGGNVLWQVEGPRLQGNKQRMRGRAAHTK